MQSVVANTGDLPTIREKITQHTEKHAVTENRIKDLEAENRRMKDDYEAKLLKMREDFVRENKEIKEILNKINITI